MSIMDKIKSIFTGGAAADPHAGHDHSHAGHDHSMEPHGYEPVAPAMPPAEPPMPAVDPAGMPTSGGMTTDDDESRS